MIVLDVPEMHCDKCVERISKALDESKLKHSVSLKEKTVSIDGCDKCASAAIEVLDDLGFSAKKH